MTTLSLTETVDLAQKVLDENKVMPASKRASSALSGRSVRWYTTAGILDAPGREGHAAAYGRRHLLQLLYTRQAQAKGATLDKIREDIAPLSTGDLSARIKLDLSLVPADLADIAPRKEQPFWERAPEETPIASSRVTRALSSTSASGPAGVGMLMVPSVSVEHVVCIGAVSVSLDHNPSQSEIASITTAAQPLLDALKSVPLYPFAGSLTQGVGAFTTHQPNHQE
jgi:DNA-binding transcriptional MerR regulator